MSVLVRLRVNGQSLRRYSNIQPDLREISISGSIHKELHNKPTAVTAARSFDRLIMYYEKNHNHPDWIG
jgi:hypothetical protein